MVRKVILVFLFVLIICFEIKVNAQANKFGIPFMQVYTADMYKGNPQNWAIIQNKTGIVYLANNELLMEYDGNSWRYYKMPNGSIVRSLALDSNGIVFVGAVNEFGFLNSKVDGALEYKSLSATLDSADRGFGDIWKVFATKKGILFYSMIPTVFFQYNYKFPLEVFQVDKKNGCFFPFQIDDEIFVGHYYHGLKKFNYSNVLTMAPGGDYYKEKDVFMMQKINDSTSIIGGPFGINYYSKSGNSSNYGYIQNAEFLNEYLKKSLFYHGIEFVNKFCIATHHNGFIMVNQSGQIEINITEQHGLPINTIYSIYNKDVKNPVWIATDKGIASIELNSGLRRFRCDYKSESELSGVVNDIICFNDIIYVATTVGVYYLSVENENIYKFKKVKGIDGAAWTFLKVKKNENSLENVLLVGTHYDLFEINNSNAKSINFRKNVWLETYRLVKKKNNPQTILLGYRKGVFEIKYANGKYDTLRKISGVDELIREIYEDDNGTLWLGTLYNGLIKIDADNKVTKFDNLACGLPDLHMIKISKIFNYPVFATKKGIYKYNEKINKFIPDSAFPEKLWKGQYGINLIAIDSNFAFVNVIDSKNKQNIEKLRFNIVSKKFELVDSITFRRIPNPSFESFYIGDENYYWIGTADAVYSYEKSFRKEHQKYFSLIRKVTTNNDSVIFMGNSVIEKPTNIMDSNIKWIPGNVQHEIQKPILSYRFNNIILHYAAPFFEDEQAITFSHLLEGYEENWSNWSSESKAVYTNLYEGTYKFRVKARNIYGLESEEAVYEFTILPPWYRTWWAFGIYIILLGLFIWGIVVIATYRMKQINIAYGRYLPGAFLKLLEKRRVMDFRLGDMIEKEMTIMFSDIRSYTNLSESMHPTDNFKFLVRYLSHVGDMLHQNNGFPVQYYGDGVMAMFHGDTDNAVQAAVDMHGKVKEYSEDRVKKGRRALQIGVGLHTGKIVMGIRGDERRWEGGIVGDAVNLAARMEGLTKMYGAYTLISDDTYNRLKNPSKFMIRFIGKVKVKGKDVPVGMYEVLNGLPVDAFNHKIATKELFDDALNNYFNGKLDRAKELFEAVAKQNPADIAASHYISLCEKFISEGIPEDWDGVEKLDKK